MLPLVSLRCVPEVAAAGVFQEKKNTGHTPTTLRNRPSEADTEQFCIYCSYAVLNRTSKFCGTLIVFFLFFFLPLKKNHVCTAEREDFC